MAIEHLVFLKRKPECTIEHAERILHAAKREFPAVPGVLDVRVAVASPQTDASRVSYCLLMRFANAESLAAYLPHPIHGAFVKEMREHFTDFAVHDFADLDANP